MSYIADSPAKGNSVPDQVALTCRDARAGHKARSPRRRESRTSRQDQVNKGRLRGTALGRENQRPPPGTAVEETQSETRNDRLHQEEKKLRCWEMRHKEDLQKMLEEEQLWKKEITSK